MSFTSFYDQLPLYDYILQLDPFAHHDYLVLLSSKLPKHASVLDAGCGYGRLAIPLARMHYSVAGFDPSSHLITEARRYARQARVAVTFKTGDLEHIPFSRTFDAVICMHGVFNCLATQRQQLRALRELERVAREMILLDFGPANWRTRKDIDVINIRGKPFWRGLQYRGASTPPTRLYSRRHILDLLSAARLTARVERYKGGVIDRFIAIIKPKKI